MQRALTRNLDLGESWSKVTLKEAEILIRDMKNATKALFTIREKYQEVPSKNHKYWGLFGIVLGPVGLGWGLALANFLTK